MSTLRLVAIVITGVSLTVNVREARGDSTLLPPPPPGYVWQTNSALTDEFNGRRLDRAKWLPYQPYWQGREPSRFAPENVAVRRGNLELKSTPAVKSPSDVKDPAHDIWIHAACVTSRAPVASYGYYEARFRGSRLPMTSSFWLQGKYSEIDIVEQVGASVLHPDHDRLMMMNTHYFAGGWPNDRSAGASWVMPTGTADEYHVYGAWWKNKDTVLYHCDGVKAGEVKTGGEFLEPMYLFFDTEAFKWEGLPTIQELKDGKRNTMFVDWVRSWTLVRARPATDSGPQGPAAPATGGGRSELLP